MTIGKLIAIWGRNGCGKTTIAAGIAKELAARDKVVGVIVADTAFSSMQHILGMTVPPERSLRAALKTHDPEKARFFAQHGKTRNLFLLALANLDDALSIAEVREDEAKGLFFSTRERFDAVLVDCTQNIREPLTFLAMYHADQIVEVIRAGTTDFMFRQSYTPYLADFGLERKSVQVVNQERGHVDIAQLESGLGVKCRHILPHTATIAALESQGETLGAHNARTRKDARYLRNLRRLVDELCAPQPLNEPKEAPAP